MSYSYTLSETETFTITHARHIASRVAADLRLLWHYYQAPTPDMIEKYLEEIAQFLAKGYLKSFEAGFKRGQRRVVSLLYEAHTDGTLGDSRSGGVRPGFDVSQAHSFSYITHSSTWWSLRPAERDAFEATLPVQRTGGPAPLDGNGYWVSDRSYAAGGVGLQRRSFMPV